MRLIRGGKEAKQAVETGGEPVVEETSAPNVTETGPVGEADAAASAKDASTGQVSPSDQTASETQLRGQLEAAKAEVSALWDQVHELEDRMAALSPKDAGRKKAQAPTTKIP